MPGYAIEIIPDDIEPSEELISTPHVDRGEGVANLCSIWFYNGRSMQGVFQPGDCLIVASASLHALKVGDIIVFRNLKGDPSREKSICVHRIIAVATGGLRTQGDRNHEPDPGLVTQDRLIGKVLRSQRNGREGMIQGGFAGLLYRSASILTDRLFNLVKSIGWIPYRWIHSSGIIRLLWSPHIRRISFTTKDGTLIKYVAGNRTIARFRPNTGWFHCRKPFDLVLPSSWRAKNKD
jgi:hypothetical protein